MEDYRSNLTACLDNAKERFAAEFGGTPTIAVSAPGRVNLIGEHTDYNGGFVLPMALPMMTVVVGRATITPGSPCTVVTTADVGPPPKCAFPVPTHPGGQLSEVVKTEYPQWAKYVVGVVALMNEGGDVPAFEAVIHTCVPLGGGVSSSASLEVAVAMFVQQLRGRGEMSEKAMAVLCQQAEHRYAGNPCGIMDQFVAARAKEGHALMIDCRTLLYDAIPFNDPDLAVLVINSGVKHELAGGQYELRRKTCEAAAETLKVTSLRTAYEEKNMDYGDKLVDGVELRRARHVITEMDRTVRAVRALEGGDYRTFGQLMNQSHDSLRDDYEVSCRELDVLVNLARQVEGVYGSRMTGGGFGGCTVTLLPLNRVETAIADIRAGAAREGLHPTAFMVVTASAGAQVLNVDGGN